MANRRDIQNLHEKFPDLTQSVLGDVLTTYQNNKELAIEALEGISEELKRETAEKLKEMTEMFPEIGVDVIQRELEKAGGNVDLAIMPLFTYNEELQKKQKKRINKQQKKKKKTKMN